MDKLIRVSEETHKRLTTLGRKGETYDEIITRLLEPNEFSQEILAVCDEIQKILDSSGMYPAKSPFRTPAFQMMAHDIRQKIGKIEALAKMGLGYKGSE
jgi:hypothetical protein